MNSKKIFEMVTERIIKMLEEGTIPWRRPWKNGHKNISVNWVTQKPYRGINQLLLPFGGEYATFKQINEAGGRVKKGEKGHIIIFCRPVTVKTQDAEEEEENEVKRYFVYRYYKVFEINTQVEGLKSKRPPVIEYEHDPIEAAERIVEHYKDKPKIRFASGKAVYYPGLDLVSVPPIEDYENREEYYSTLFHELVHSTGHHTRLNRNGVVNSDGFGGEKYAFEELVAEIGASMLCTEAGIEHKTIDNSAAYIDHWLSHLRKDPKLIILAARHAQRAFDYMLGINYEEQGESA